MKKQYLALAAIFLAAFGLRLYFGLQSAEFSDDVSYYTLRQVEHIQATGRLLVADPLSYGGREQLTLPLYYYLLAGMTYPFQQPAASKIAANLLASSLVVIIYLILRQTTKDESASLLAALVSGFIPIYVSETVNSLTQYSLAIPLAFLLVYLFLQKRYLPFLIVLCAYMLTSASALLVVLVLLLYLVFLWIEGFRPSRAELELTLFSLLMISWFYIIHYRDALVMHGLGIVWYNMPREVVLQYFSGIDLFTAIYQIGIVPVLSGAVVLYYYSVRKKRKSAYLLISYLIIMALLLLAGWIPLAYGLMLIGVILMVMFGEFYVLAMSYLSQTRLWGFRQYIVISFFMLFLATSLMPTFSSAGQALARSTAPDSAFAFRFLKNITSSEEVIVGTVFEGHLINYYSGRKNIIDTNFLLVDDTDGRLRDLRSIYTSANEFRPFELMHKYGADYIVFSDEAKAYYNITRISYAGGECFPIVFSGRTVKVYKREC